MWFGATETWAAAGLLSLAIGGRLLHVATAGMSIATGIRLLYCELERPGNLPSYPPEQHYA